MEIVTVDNFEFWFMGFLNYQKAIICLHQALSQSWFLNELQINPEMSQAETFLYGLDSRRNVFSPLLRPMYLHEAKAKRLLRTAKNSV